MITQLINVPRDENEWNIWSWHHRLSHTAIRQACDKAGHAVNDYQIDPIPSNDLVDWLQNNQQLHFEMNAAVGSQGVDLEDVDLNDPRQLESWVYLHFLEHQTAEQRLGIGS